MILIMAESIPMPFFPPDPNRNGGCVLRKNWKRLLASVLLAACLLSLPAMAVTFTDVSGHWAESYITRAADRGLIQGYDGKYSPDDPMTRSQLVTILWRACGSPEPKGAATFTDLTQDWYKKPVAWAQENGVINGTGEGKFSPEGLVTREQLVTVLHRLSGEGSGMELMFTSIYNQNHPDYAQIGSYAKAAMYWSVYNEVYCGKTSPEFATGEPFAPLEPATRGQIAVMIIRYLDRND